MIDVQSVGYYDVAVRLSEVWYFIPAIITASLFPAIINAKTSSALQYGQRLLKLSGLLFFISVVIALPITLLAPIIIKILYGAEFLPAIGVLKIYVWAGVGAALGALVNSYLVAENYKSIIFTISFVSMSINVILNLILIPKTGIIGAAWATLISYSFMPLSLLFFKKIRTHLFIKQHGN